MKYSDESINNLPIILSLKKCKVDPHEKLDIRRPKEEHPE